MTFFFGVERHKFKENIYEEQGVGMSAIKTPMCTKMADMSTIVLNLGGK